MAETSIDKLSFEDALHELEAIVEKLERGDAPLEESIEIYQRGAALKTHCDGKLKQAQLKVEKIVLNSQDQDQKETKPFDSH